MQWKNYIAMGDWNCIAIEVDWLGKICIAILVLYCNLKASRDEVPVSQYTVVYCGQEEN